MNWFLDTIKNRYAQFDGRARRKEYWLFNLFYWLILLAIWIIFGFGSSEKVMNIGFSIALIFMLGLIVPMWAVTIRRLHDIGKSGWWILIGSVPYIGSFILLIFCCLDSEPGANKYGPNPKGIMS
ncbi:DUF805 domain-containing protein [Psychrobacter lutiphocae]|uniref:DUF805 domain-containing protein n=1 Tax=Psychrobacter lutiphocae TaxID=540500 RepID=UPI000366B5F2|nr:DUF805 domain-containing protein [Psychrobacter lutiphocae]